jgi:hypothetical protein
MKDLFNRAFIAPFQQLFDQIVAFLPNLLAMVMILVFGIAVAVFLHWMLARGLKYSGFDDLARRGGLQAALSKANIHRAPAALAADVVYGFVLLITLLLGLSALNLEATSQMVAGVFATIPKLIVSVIIFFVGYLLSQFFGRSVLIAAVNAEWRAARLISYSIQALILLFTLSVSLEQIGLGRNTIIATFSILFGGIVLGLAIAFGLGGRNLARDFLQQRLKRDGDEKRRSQPFSHL